MISFRKVERVMIITHVEYYVVRKGRGGGGGGKKKKKKKGKRENGKFRGDRVPLLYRDMLFGNIFCTRYRESILRLQITDE